MVFTSRLFAGKDSPGRRKGKEPVFCTDRSHFASPFLLLAAIRAFVIGSKKMAPRSKAPGAGQTELTWSTGWGEIGELVSA